ncbi:MAG TPA: hypothetical protein VHS74_12540 [Solirubrobacterales bacterium]|nr:hypothetical protein [Solirubrobacterales bacterium]
MGMLTTAEVAAEVRMSADWVREHAAELGGVRAGRTCRAPLRFEPEGIAAWKRAHRLARPVAQTTQRRRRHRAPADVELLPLPASVVSGRG